MREIRHQDINCVLRTSHLCYGQGTRKDLLDRCCTNHNVPILTTERYEHMTNRAVVQRPTIHNQARLHQHSRKHYIHSFTSLTPIPFSPLPKHILSDLPRTSLWQFLHNLAFPGNHKSRHTRMISAPLFERFIGQLLSRLDSDECFWAFTPLLITDGCNTAFKNIGVRDDYAFESYRGDVFAAWEDH